METAAASMINLPAAPPPSPSPADLAPPPARADVPGPDRSFAATLAHERPDCAGGADPASTDASSAAAESTSQTGAQPAGTAPKDAKAAGRPKAATGGDRSPVDGSALPLWLPPPVQAGTPLPNAAGAAAQPATDRASAVAATDATRQAAQAAERSGAHIAPAARHQEEDAAAATVEAAAAGATAGESVAAAPSPSAQGPAGASAMEATPAKAATTPERVQTPSSGTATSGLGAPLGIAVAEPGAPLAAAAPPSLKPAAAVAPQAPVATAPTALAPKAIRSPAAAADALRSAAPAADNASALPPVATDLEHAVAAVLSTDTKHELASTPAAVKVAMDATAGVPPPTPAAAAERAAAPTVAQVSTPLGAPGWAHELADRVSVLVNQNLTHAQIKLSPADLGPIEVRIALSDGQANVSFTTHSHSTSEALQAAAPRLREALNSQGYSSVNVDVAHQQFRGRTPPQTRYEPDPTVAASAPQGATGAAARIAGIASAALRLDAYA